MHSGSSAPISQWGITEKGVFLLLLSGAILFISLAGCHPDILLLNLFPLIYLTAGYLLFPLVDDANLHLERSVLIECSKGTYRVIVTVRMTNTGTRGLFVKADDPLPPLAQITAGSSRLNTFLPSGSEEELSYTFETKRASFKWSETSIKVSDPFHCFNRELILPSEGELELPLYYRKIKAFPICPWKTLSSPGTLPGRVNGRGTDFRGVREYHPGDTLQTLDWRLSSRHPGRFFTREYEEEKNAEIRFIIDAGYESSQGTPGRTILDEFLQQTASLSEMFSRQGQKTGLTIVSDQITQTSAGTGKKQHRKILKCLSESIPGTAENQLLRSSLVTRTISPRAVVFLFSPYRPGDIELYKDLRHRHIQVILICPDPFDRETVKPSQSTPALRAAKIERKANLTQLSMLSVSVIDWKKGESLFPLIRKAFYFHKPIKKM